LPEAEATAAASLTIPPPERFNDPAEQHEDTASIFPER